MASFSTSVGAGALGASGALSAAGLALWPQAARPRAPAITIAEPAARRVEGKDERRDMTHFLAEGHGLAHGGVAAMDSLSKRRRAASAADGELHHDMGGGVDDGLGRVGASHQFEAGGYGFHQVRRF